MPAHFFTVFDKNYAARGLVMLASLRRVSPNPPKVTVLALDEDTRREVLREGNFEVLAVEDLGDSEALAARDNRSHAEFCWTCAPLLSDFMVRRAAPGDFVAYLDADLCFYTDPQALLAEMGDDKNILIHPHRFSPDRVAWEAMAGTFNVGFVGFRVSDEARACTARWRAQVLESCVKDPDKGLCGDQGYLNEWPSRYPGLRIMQNIGGGVAPWNVAAYQVGGSDDKPTIDGQPVVFYHFHQLRIVDCGAYRFMGVCYADGYFFRAEVHRLIYENYVRALKAQTLGLERRGVALRPEREYDATTFHRRIRTREVHPVLDSWAAKVRYALTFLAYVAERVASKSHAREA